MRWDEQTEERVALSDAASPALIAGHVRSVRTPDFRGVTFHEVRAKSVLNRVPLASSMPFSWSVNPYRGCSHACVYCFARGTHRYLDLNPGEDFDRQLIVKTNAAEVLRSELSRLSWRRELVALGTNTDPYQRAEGRYQLMPGIIAALRDATTPLSILTKGTLLRRDLPLLREAAGRSPVDLSVSIAIFDDGLQKDLEPGTPSTAARLETVRAATKAGFDVSVFLMPVLPWLTDSDEQLERAVACIAEAGARRVVYGALHLRPGAREWFMSWLHRERPDLVRGYDAFYGRSSYAPTSYRRELARRMRAHLGAYGLLARDDDDQPEIRRLAVAAAPNGAATLTPPGQGTLF